jgi:hypothetical protein
MKYGKIKLNSDSVYVENNSGDLKFVDESNPTGVSLSSISSGTVYYNSYVLQFTASDLVNSILTVNHNLNDKYIGGYDSLVNFFNQTI